MIYLSCLYMNKTNNSLNLFSVLRRADLDVVIRLLAENVHDTWAKGRMDAGWTYGPVRETRRNSTPASFHTATCPNPKSHTTATLQFQP